VIIVLQANYSNEDIVDLMRQARDAWRKNNDRAYVVLNLHGYNDDPRELQQIPEARALAKRAWDLGLGSWLLPVTGIRPPDEVGKTFPFEFVRMLFDMGTPAAGLGAFELYNLAMGNMKDAPKGSGLGACASGSWEELLRWFETELVAANQRSDALLGD
jgi:hypothetical protein